MLTLWAGQARVRGKIENPKKQTMNPKILVTGGAGFIGSHTCLELLQQNYDVVAVDNFANSHIESLNRVQKIANRTLTFVELDLLDIPALKSVFEKHSFDAVIHFAGMKAVGESNEIPLTYYNNNITSSLNLLEVMKQNQVHNLVFSSSATVYGSSDEVPLKESTPTSAINPYGKTKWFSEMIFEDFQKAHPEWNIALLRYFNPIGAHESGQMGEDPNGIPNNLTPFVSQTLIGEHDHVRIFGDDYPTKDGTGVRDYIHVLDLADGHIKALDHLIQQKPGLDVFNLGTGEGSSVYDVIHAFEKAAGKKVPVKVYPRREGDAPTSYADVSKAEEILGWKAQRNLDDMCRDTWSWQTQNPQGYRG